MSWKIFLVLLYLYGVATDICEGDDFDDSHCKEYREIKNSSLYDRNPESVGDLSKRPLGFQSATIPFVAINPNARNPCFKIFLKNSTQQTVQVLAKSTVGDTVFCVKSQPPYDFPTCQSGIKTCQDSPIGYNSLKYVFYCPSCDAELTIWFRLSVSPSFTDGLDFEHWCQREAEYPDSLITLPTDLQHGTTPKTDQEPRRNFSISPSAGGNRDVSFTTPMGMRSGNTQRSVTTMTTSSFNTTNSPNGSAHFLVPSILNLIMSAILSLVSYVLRLA